MFKLNLNPFSMLNQNLTKKAPKGISNPISSKYENKDRDTVSFTGHYETKHKISGYHNVSGVIKTDYSNETYEAWVDDAPHVLSDMTKKMNSLSSMCFWQIENLAFGT